MSSEELERRYRKLLKVLPKSYRAAREEELLSVFMDGAADGRRWPEFREVLSLARLGFQARTGGAKAENTVLETKRLGEMARLVGVVGSMLLAYVGVTQLALIMRNLKMLPNYKPWQILNPFVKPVGGPQTLPGFTILQYEAPACWLLVLALLALGWWRSARVLAVAVLLLSAYLTDDMMTAMHEETALAAVTTAALFAARGPHARPVRLPGLAAVVALVGVMGYTYRSQGGPLLRALSALQGWGDTDSGHAMVMVGIVVAAVCVVAYRSVVWPVVLAVVGLAALGPAIAQESLLPQVVRVDAIPLLSLTCALVVVAGLAVLKEHLSRRSGLVEP